MLAGRGRASAQVAAQARRTGPGRVRERQPDGPDARRPRAQRRLRRRAGAAARAVRARRDARVLRQRRRLPGGASWASRSLALARGEEVPEDGYNGEYVAELAREVADAAAGDPAAVGQAAVAAMVERMRASLDAFGVRDFDRWQYESELHEGSPSHVEHALTAAGGEGHTYRSEGALWLRTTAYGDDKDRVLVRSTGEHTYFASDIAYHQDKRERGYRTPDRRVGRRPPRVCGADEGGLRGAGRRRGPSGDADHAARAPGAPRRARADVQARGRVRDARTISWRRSEWTPRAGSCSRARTTPRSTSTSTSRARSSQREPGVLRAVRARADRLGVGEGGRHAGRSGAREGGGRGGPPRS